MVVGREDQAAGGTEGIAFRHQLDRRAGIGGEDHLIEVRVGVEEGQRLPPRRFHGVCAGPGGGVLGMGIAVEAVVQPLGIAGEVRGAIKRAGGEVEIGDALGVEPGEVPGAQGVEVDGQGTV